MSNTQENTDLHEIIAKHDWLLKMYRCSDLSQNGEQNALDLAKLISKGWELEMMGIHQTIVGYDTAEDLSEGEGRTLYAMMPTSIGIVRSPMLCDTNEDDDCVHHSTKPLPERGSADSHYCCRKCLRKILFFAEQLEKKPTFTLTDPRKPSDDDDDDEAGYEPCWGY